MNLTTALFSCATLWSVCAFAANEPMTDAVPGRPLAFVGWVGADNLPDKAIKSDLGRLLAEPEVRQFVQAYSKLIRYGLSSNFPENDRKFVLELMDNLVVLVRARPTAVYLDGLSIEPGQFIPSIAVVIDDPKSLALPIVQGVLSRAFPEGKAPPLIKRTLHGATYEEVNLDQPVRPAWGRVGNRFFLTTEPRLTKRIVSVLAGKADEAGGTLAADKEFRFVFDRIAPAAPVLSVYVDGARLRQEVVSLVIDAMGRDNGIAARAAAATLSAAVVGKLGLADLGGIGMTVDFAGTRTRNTFYVHAPAPRRGVLALLDGEPLSDSAIAVAPGDANGVVALAMDWRRLWDTIYGTLAAIPDGPVKGIDDALRKAKEQTGVDIERDVLDSLGRSTVTYNSPRIGGDAFLGAILVFEVNRPDTLRKADADLAVYLEKQIKESNRARREGAKAIRKAEAAPAIEEKAFEPKKEDSKDEPKKEDSKDEPKKEDPKDEPKKEEFKKEELKKDEGHDHDDDDGLPSYFRSKAGLFSQKVAGRTLRYFSEGRMPFAPAWCITGKHLVVGLTPQSVAAAVRHIESGDKGLPAAPAFASVRKPLGAGGSYMSYGDTPYNIEILSGLGLMIGNLMAGQIEHQFGRDGAAKRATKPTLEPGDFPSPDVVKPYFPPTLAVIRTDADGIAGESHSTLPLYLDSPLLIGPGPAVPTLGYGGAALFFFLVFR